MILASQETKSRACWVEGASYTNPALQRSRAERVPRLLLAVSFTIQNIMYVLMQVLQTVLRGWGPDVPYRRWEESTNPVRFLQGRCAFYAQQCTMV